MHKILPAIAFCLALPAAAYADNVAQGHKPAQPLARDGLMHATLVVPAAGPVGPRAPEPAVRQAALDDDVQGPPSDGGEQSAERGMLLAALVLMAGIVLRRWSGTRP